MKKGSPSTAWHHCHEKSFLFQDEFHTAELFFYLLLLCSPFKTATLHPVIMTNQSRDCQFAATFCYPFVWMTPPPSLGWDCGWVQKRKAFHFVRARAKEKFIVHPRNCHREKMMKTTNYDGDDDDAGKLRHSWWSGGVFPSLFLGKKGVGKPN